MSTIVMICKVQKPAQSVEIPINHKNCNKQTVFMSHKFLIISVTIQVFFLLHRLRRRGEGEGRGHPAPRQGALQAPWNPLLTSYPLAISRYLLIYWYISFITLFTRGVSRPCMQLQMSLLPEEG